MKELLLGLCYRKCWQLLCSFSRCTRSGVLKWEILKLLRQINVKALNAVLFLRDEAAPEAEPAPTDGGKAELTNLFAIGTR